ncbi:MAG: prepilin-type N-terminal cleavage/methylation domain-containing protein [Candidatus Shapirobacteria bacterium]
MKNKNQRTKPLFSLRSKTSLKKGGFNFGFTLVELLVVISIIGILTMIGAVAFSGAQKKARDTQRKTELDALSKALIMYYNDNGVLPDLNSDAFLGSSVGLTGPGGIVYMAEMPKDPKNVDPYIYSYRHKTDNKTFYLFANLENKSDSQCKSAFVSNSVTYCYGISSPNSALTSGFDETKL